MEYTNLRKSGQFDEFWSKKYDVCVPWTPKYPMGLTQVPKPMALTACTMLSFQCLVASSVGQSMPHSCSFRDPMCFPFSNSRNMPATKIKSLHITTACRLFWQDVSAIKNVPYGDRNFKDKCGIKLKIIKKNILKKDFETMWFLLFSTRFISFFLMWDTD